MLGLRRAIRIGSIVSLILLALGFALNLLTESLICFSRCPSPEGYADAALQYALVLLGPGAGTALVVWVLWLVLFGRTRAWVSFAVVGLAVPLLALLAANFVWAGAPWTGHILLEEPIDPTTQGLPGRLGLVAIGIGVAGVISLLASRLRPRLSGEALTTFLSDASS